MRPARLGFLLPLGPLLRPRRRTATVIATGSVGERERAPGLGSGPGWQLITLALILAAAPRPALAQPPAAQPAPSTDRVAFAPGMAGWTQLGPDQGYGLKAQNLGRGPSRILLLAHKDPAGTAVGGCAACPGFSAACSPVLAPGQAFAFSPAGAATLYSLSLRPAEEAGPAWSALARARGLPPQTPLADLVCRTLAEVTGPPATPVALAAGPSSATALPASGQPSSSAASRRHRAERAAAADLDCGLQRAFHGAYLGGGGMGEGSPLAEAPLELLRGEPLAAAAAFEMPTINAREQVDAAQPALDREAALSLSDTGADAPREGPYVYLLPGVFLATPEWQRGLLWLQSAVSDCTQLTVEAFRSSRGKLPGELHLALAGGALTKLWPSQTWPDGIAATLKISSDRPLAAMASQLGYRTSASFNATLDRPGPAAWALPLAYQEPAPLPPPARLLSPSGSPRPYRALFPSPKPVGGRGRGEGAGRRAEAPAGEGRAEEAGLRQAAPAGGVRREGPGANLSEASATRAGAMAEAELRRTQVAAFNNGSQWDDLRVDTQAQGQDPRGVPLPMAPQMQLLFELGFGLGRVGGEGWARLADGAMPFAAAFYSYRLSAGEEAATEAWAAPAWRYAPQVGAGWTAPKGIAFPDAGPRASEGPAAGATDGEAPVARLALQNLRDSRGRVVIDSYDPRCGYNGSLEIALPPLEARLLPVEQLPGAPWRSGSLVLRVVEGEAAALLEVARPRSFPITAFPPDLGDALLGVPLPDEPPPPALREALLEASPSQLDLPRPVQPLRRQIVLRDGLASGRCLSYRAESTAPWLRAETPQGQLPADLSLLIDPAQLPAGPQEALLRITVPEGNALGNPATVRVRVAGGAGEGRVWLPRVAGGAGER